MKRILITGMSGTGKTSVLEELARRGYRTVETDIGGWSVWHDTDSGWLWNEARMAALLAEESDAPLFVSGCVANQGRFYDRFDAVVLLSAPLDVILQRVQERTNNPYGKTAEQQAEIAANLREVEPLLRRGATLVLDSSLLGVQKVAEVVERLLHPRSSLLPLTGDARNFHWHDATVLHVSRDELQRQVTWKIIRPSWETDLDTEPIPGWLRFNGVTLVTGKDDLTGFNFNGGVNWDVLRADFQASPQGLQCHFLFSLPHYRGQPAGYGELYIVCQAATFQADQDTEGRQ